MSILCSQALNLAQRFGLPDIETLAEFSIACINKDSTQFTEREEAQKTFIKLIPYFGKHYIYYDKKKG